jgi:hypothetical protein
MKFYEFSSSHVGGRTFPWASGYGPLPEMPFLDVLPDAFRERRMQYWKVNPSPPGIDIDPGGRTWSDMIGSGLGLPSHFVSERIIRDWNENSIPFLRATEIPIASIMAKALKKIPPPKYYVLEAEPGLVVWSEKISIEDQIAASKETPRRFLLPSRLKGKADSWNGKDLMSPISATGNLVTISLYCTERIKELAEQKGWTNVKFEEIELM